MLTLLQVKESKHMYRHYIFILLLFLIGHKGLAQESYTISGVVTDGESGETLPSATVTVKELGKTAVTNLYGFYSITLPKGTYTLEYNFIGFASITETVNLDKDIKLNKELNSGNIQLETVTIAVEKADKNVNEVEMSTNELKIEEIKKLPAFLGEVDVIKTIQLLPGVTTVGEGANGFNVRGGAADQNLVLLDEANVFSSSHLFGFFSVFNADVIKDVKLYKGGIPARYGGRLSSVLDVRQKEGNNKKFAATGGIGTVSSRLTIEGPIVKEKGSFVVAGRRSYADLFLKLSPDSNINQTQAFFYDLNLKANYKLNENNRVFLSGYFGRDVFNFQNVFGFDWGNRTATLRWNHIFTDKLFANFSGIYSNYDYSLGGDEFFIWTSVINNYNFKADFDYYLNDKHKIELGASNIYYRFRPGKVEPQGIFRDIFQEFDLDLEQAHEPAVYFSEEYKPNNKLTILAGLRFSSFINVGPYTSLIYQDGLPLNDNNVIDTVKYERGDVVQSYSGFEPRLAFKYSVDSSSSVKLSYMRTRQYLHLISNTTNGLPTDLWKASDEYIKPAIADQVAVGYFRNFRDNTLEGSVEVYYKNMQNIVDYKNNAELFLNETIETELLTGVGRAYGLEFMLRKQTGRLTGWLSYTLARTERKVAGDTFEETINEGEWYVSNYDKPHDVTLVLAYDINKKLNVSMNFTYSAGRPVTYPDSKYEYEGFILPNYVSRNQDRIPDYHRLDLAATYDWGNHSLVLSIYNVYGRRNAYAINFTTSEDDPNKTETTRISILGSILPSLTYNFKF